MEFGRFHEFLSLPGHSHTEAIDEGMEHYRLLIAEPARRSGRQSLSNAPRSCAH